MSLHRTAGSKAPHGPVPGDAQPAVLTSTVRLPGVVLPSEGDVIEFGTLQLSKVLGARRAVLRPHSQ